MPRCSEWIVTDGHTHQCPNEGITSYEGRRVCLRHHEIRAEWAHDAKVRNEGLRQAYAYRVLSRR